MTPEQLQELFSYEPETGAFVWRARPSWVVNNPAYLARGNQPRVGDPAFTYRHCQGYLQQHIRGKSILAHRAAWAIVHGEWPQITDHVNGDRSDNRLANLRSVSQRDNSRNQGLHSRNKTGVTGVFLRSDGRYLANIRHEGKTKHLGLFATLDEAATARRDAEQRLGYASGHGKRERWCAQAGLTIEHFDDALNQTEAA